MKIDVVKGSSGQENQYNLNFTLIGQYAYISDFLSAVENDAKLGFRIDKFLLVPVTQSNEGQANANLLQATFTVENVGINIDLNNTSIKNEKNNEISKESKVVSEDTNTNKQ